MRRSLVQSLKNIDKVVGNAALLVDPLNAQAIADAIQRIFLDQEVKKELIRRDFERVKLFPWEKTAWETHQVYTQRMPVNGDV